MNYLSVENLTKHYGDILLFENITFHLNEGDKVALIGKNGSGKSSLLKIIAGIDIADEGETRINSNYNWGYLPQEPPLNPELNVWDAVFDSNNPTLSAIREYEYCLDHTDSVATERFEKALAQMEELKAWDYETKIKSILSNLKINDLERLIKVLSGGQKKRIALAKILIEAPQFLILDEPTNHLDLDMIEWLESYLSKQKMTLLMVTHDRYFLDNVCERILDLDRHEIRTYNGNYAYFMEKKADLIASESATIDKARNLFRKEQEWMRRMPKARTTKSKSRINAFYEIKKIAHQKREEDQILMDVKMTRLGNKIVNIKNLKKAYGEDTIILDGFDYNFRKGERLGIVGDNGVGKSTFLNMIAGLEKQDSGHIDVGETVQIGYYTQSGIQLKGDRKVIDVIKEIAEFIPMSDGSKLSAASLLIMFAFPPKKQQAYVSTLSGGERRRLYLLTILVKNPNFLILDEPTNDLDLITLHTLEDFLMNFQGCVIIVSHDRYFMDKLVDHIFVFEGKGQIRDFNGIYSEYRIDLDERKRKQRQEARELEELQKAIKQEEKDQQNQSQTAIKPSSEKKKLSFNEKREFESLEGEIFELEEQKTELEAELSKGGDNKTIMELSAKLSDVCSQLQDKETRWMELADRA